MNLQWIYKQESEMVSVKAIIANKYEAKHGPFYQCLSRALVKSGRLIMEEALWETM